MRAPPMMTVLSVTVAAMLAGCAASARQGDHAAAAAFDADPTTVEREINRLLDAWHAAAASGDGEAYFSRLTDDAVFIGTDAAERWPGPAFRAFAEPYFDGEEAWTYVPTERTIETATAGRGVVWFDELLTNAKYGTSRGTGIAVVDAIGGAGGAGGAGGEGGAGGRWKIAAYALTFPMPNELAVNMTAEIKAFEALERTPAAPPEPISETTFETDSNR